MVADLQAMSAEMQLQDQVDPDSIKSEDLTLPEATESEGSIKRREAKFQRLEGVSAEEMEEAVNNGPSIFAENYNDVGDKEMTKLVSRYEKEPEPFRELFKKALQIEESQVEEAVMDAKYEIPESLIEQEPEVEANEKALIFFEEQELYREFAKSFLAQNGEGMSAEELAKLKQVQEMIRENERQKVPESDDDIFSMTREEIEMRRSPHPFTALQEDADALSLNKPELEDDVMPAIDFDAFTKENQGTHEGTRRFERVDRVSLDAEHDRFNKLKLEARHGRVYDQLAAQAVIENATIAESTHDLTTHMMEAVEFKKVEAPTESGTELSELEKEVEYFTLRKREGFVEEPMPEGLSLEEQVAWKED
jgi:hypothetical protein